jgi:uncharacterized protein
VLLGDVGQAPGFSLFSPLETPVKKIPVERLTPTPTAYDLEGDAAWWARLLASGLELPREPVQPFRFALRAHRMGEDLYLEGVAEGEIELECSRCTARYRHRLREPFRLVLEPAGDRIPADPEAAEALSQYGVCLGDELETAWFRGNEIDLGGFFQELVALSLPVKPLCREDCPGLCGRCGAELAAGPCGCQEKRTDSPFAVLAALRGGPRGGGD